MTKSNHNLFQQCSDDFQDKTLKLEEKGKKFCLENLDPKIIIQKVKIDGCLINEGKRCDWLLLIKDRNLEIYIELKGRRVDEAFQQLEETLKNQELKDILDQQWKKQDRKKRCYVIHSRCPSASTDVQDQQSLFKKKYKVTLKVEKSSYKEKLSKVLKDEGL